VHALAAFPRALPAITHALVAFPRAHSAFLSFHALVPRDAGAIAGALALVPRDAGAIAGAHALVPRDDAAIAGAFAAIPRARAALAHDRAGGTLWHAAGVDFRGNSETLRGAFIAKLGGVRTACAVLFALSVAGCSSSSTISPSSDSGPPPHDASATDAAATDAATTTDGAACPTSATAFKACSLTSDCLLVRVPNCCGAQPISGIASAALADYDRCFPPANCNGLGCAGSSVCTAEDGKTADCVGGLPSSGIQATCLQGLCESFVAADAALE